MTCSAGGHLTEALQLMPVVRKYNFFFFTFFVSHLKESLKKYNVHYTLNPKRNPARFIKVFSDSVKALFKEKPKVIISTGAGVTVPICILGKLLLRAKIIYVDCSAQVYKPSMTGRILYWFADLFFVQWKYLLKSYGKKAIYGGLLI
jgi:UDP-N-acetylglucosamine:LPS N-acetylglucosamine transferase